MSERDRGTRSFVGSVGWRGLALIAGFWGLFGSMMAASLLLSPTRETAAAPAEIFGFTFLGALTWALLTLPLFWLTRRFGLHGEGRLGHVVFLGALALVLAAVVSGSVAGVSSLFADETFDGALQGPEGVWRMARYRFLHDLLACLLILTAGVARDYFLRYRARQEEASLLRTQLVESRLAMLRAQLNPHFLFNTLNAVAALVTKDPRGVRRMIARMSELLRYTLEDSDEPEIPVEQELEILGRYLEVMEIRYQGRLDTEVQADPDVLDALVPNLVLQPLVENSMKHGVSRAARPSRVAVGARREGETVRLTVRDDGAGAATEATEATGGADGTPNDGIGLRHTRERLRQLYGDAARLELRFPPEGGAVAEIVLPYHTRSTLGSTVDAPDRRARRPTARASAGGLRE